MTSELSDTAEAMERKETARALPVGWLVLFFGLIAFGAWYLYAYSPWLSGWTQEGELQAAQAGGGSGASIGNTIAFTAIPAAVLAWLWATLRRRGTGKPR
jgi:hypothetical protein